jgi:signal peptidase I
MSGIQWVVFALIIQVVHFLGTWKLYKAAGEAPWKAIVPIYNAIVLMKIIHRPKWWVVLLFLPVINLMIFMVLWIDIAKRLGAGELRVLPLHHKLSKSTEIHRRQNADHKISLW